MLQAPFNCCPFNTSLQVHTLVNEISLQMDIKAIIIIQLPWYCRYHIIHIYRYIDDLPYNTLSSDLMSQSSDLHKWKSWGHNPFPYTIQQRQMHGIGRICKAVTAC
jgi:hypothetical protein